MDFAREHIREESLATNSRICFQKDTNQEELDGLSIDAANQAAKDLFLGPITNQDMDVKKLIDGKLYPERVTPQSETIQKNQLVVIFESFDNLNFVYATPKDIFSNRNGHFHHDDFIGKPFGCKIRSRNNQGYGFCYLLKPTSELWSRSLMHRTQIVNELDAAMIVYYLNLRPNMVVCESGTGSGSMSHAILRTIAPQGKLHTYEFNRVRADSAKEEFAKNGVSHLVQVHHRDVCGRTTATTGGKDNKDTTDINNKNVGGFNLPGQSVSAIILDLPEPWLAIPHAAYVIKSNCRIASYSPCIEQSQRAVVALKKHGFHSIRTLEFRMRENYVDEVEFEPPPKEKRPRLEPHNISSYIVHLNNNSGKKNKNIDAIASTSNNGKSGSSSDEQNNKNTLIEKGGKSSSDEEIKVENNKRKTLSSPSGNDGTSCATDANKQKSDNSGDGGSEYIHRGVTACSNNKMLVARPKMMMRGHTAFLTFATAGISPQLDPNSC